MPPPPKVDRLPEDVRGELDRRLIAAGFCNYEAFKSWLGDLGYDVSVTAIWKHGKKLKQRIEAIKVSTQAAQLLAETAPDEAGALSSAVLNLVQTEMFDLMVNLQEVEDAEDMGARVKLLGNAAHAMADLARASLKQKEWANKVRERAEAAAAAVEKITRKGGLSAEAANEIRREILGIAA